MFNLPVEHLSVKTRGKQCIGNATDHFRSRWNNHKSDAKNLENGNMENVKQKYLENLFLQRDHQSFSEEEKVRLTDKMQVSDPTKKELNWMIKLRTLYPDGLNIESDY